MQKSCIVVLITMIVVALFAVLNADPVTVNLMFAKYNMSQAVVILISASLGAVSMFVLNVVNSLKLKRQIKQLSKKLIDSDAKNADLTAKLNDVSNQNTTDNEPLIDHSKIEQYVDNSTEELVNQADKDI